MNPTPLTTIVKWTNGALLQGDSAAKVTRVCTDSRALEKGDLFIALRGEKFDAHDFVANAAELGAAGVVVESLDENLPTKFPVICVADTLKALQQLAANYRQSLTLTVVAITGSNGKTSTKDFTAAVLSERYSVIKTEGNLNNHIGLPLTILRADDSHGIGVFEIGMNHPGEISPLAEIAKPQVAIITNIGMAHIEFMKTQDAIALEKGTLAEAVSADGCVILNANDAFTPAISQRTKARVVLAGIGVGEIYAENATINLQRGEFVVSDGEKSLVARIAPPARHMISNALMAIAAGRALGVSLEECVTGLAKAKLTKGRLERKSIRGIEVLDDTYNANPDSVRAALQTLAEMVVSGRHIAVLGRMGELGEESERGHRMVGEAAGRAKVDCVIGVGDETAALVKSALRCGVTTTYCVATTAEATELLRSWAKSGDAVLVKGSRAARMETIVEGLAT